MPRLNVHVTEQAKKEIDDLQRVSGAASLTEVVRAALRLYGEVIRARARGETLQLRSEDGEVREVWLVT